MKKSLTVAAVVLVSIMACNNGDTKQGAASDKTTESKDAQSREKEINDSTKILDKKLADPNSTYSPDSLK